jgi:hypothetical protein
LTLYFKGRDIIACRTYLLERGVNIKGVGIEPVYYSKIYKKFVSEKFSNTKVVFEGIILSISLRTLIMVSGK